MTILAWKSKYDTNRITFIGQIINCFSIEDNLQRIMKPNVNLFPAISFLRYKNENFITAFFLLLNKFISRVFASVNIIVYHLNHFGLHATKNESVFYAYLEQFRLPWSMVTLFIVDLYFVIRFETVYIISSGVFLNFNCFQCFYSII